MYLKRNGQVYFSSSIKRCLRLLALEIPFQRRNFIEWRKILIKMGIPDPVEGVVASSRTFFHQFRREMRQATY
jgi:hypothetical protein